MQRFSPVPYGNDGLSSPIQKFESSVNVDFHGESGAENTLLGTVVCSRPKGPV